MTLALKIDGLIRLFDGDFTPTEILSMDIPSQRAMVKARLEALKRSQENYNNGILDAYSRRYAATMGTSSGHSAYMTPSSSSQSIEDHSDDNNNTIDRSSSLNIRDLGKN
jgi:hypothetical protein